MVENTVRDQETGLQFTINLNDHNPPHAHVYRNRELVARIEIETLKFMRPVPGNPQIRRRVRQALARCQAELTKLWQEIHGENYRR